VRIIEDLSKLLSFEMKFYQSPGRIIDELIKTLKANFGIFIENFLELKKALFIFEIDEFEYSNININNDRYYFHYIKEILRLFHNYITSSVSFLEHCNGLMSDLFEEESEQMKIYQTKKDHFYNNELFCFVRVLRNYIVHKNCNIVGVVHNWDSTGYSKFIELRTDEINTWIDNALGKFKKKTIRKTYIKAREYLENKKFERIQLPTLINEYGNYIVNLFLWIEDSIKRKYKKELEEYGELINEFKKVNPEATWMMLS